MSTPSMDDFLNRAKTFSFSFKGEAPKSVRGTVISAEMMQQQDFETGKLKFWNANNQPEAADLDAQGNAPVGFRPMWQLAVRLQTSLRNGEGAAKPHEVVNDDGVRGVYLSGNKLKAVQDAFTAKGINTVKLEPGDDLFLEFYAEDFAKQKGNFNPPKLFRAEITKGAGAQAAVWDQPAAAPVAGGWDVPAVAPVAVAPQPVYAQPAPVAQPAVTYVAPQAPAPVAAAAPQGIPPETLAQLPDATIQMLKAQGQIPADYVKPV